METGIHHGLSIEDYHRDRTIISSTGLKEVKRSTRNFVYYVLNGTKQRPAFDFGNAFELAVMDKVNGTKHFENEVAIMPTEKWREDALAEKPDLKNPALSKSYQSAKREFEQDAFGKYVITDVGDLESKEALDEMVDSCVGNETIARLLKGTDYQVSLVWKDDETGLLCKTRPDVCKAKKNVLVDIKTCKDASPEGFARDAANLDYPLQAVMQIEGARKTGLIDDIDFYYWLAVEKTPPYNVALYEYQRDDIEWMHDVYTYYLKRCAKGLQTILDMEKDKNTRMSGIASYGEQADNRHGILILEIPLWYKTRFN